MIAHCEACWVELPPRKTGAPQRFCLDCRRVRYRPESEDHLSRRLLREALDELFPFGLTDECPARRELVACARLKELRAEGFDVEAERIDAHQFRYILRFDPERDSDPARLDSAPSSEREASGSATAAPDQRRKDRDTEAPPIAEDAALFDMAEIDIAPPRRYADPEAA